MIRAPITVRLNHGVFLIDLPFSLCVLRVLCGYLFIVLVAEATEYSHSAAHSLIQQKVPLVAGL
jgi:hypothetical protein